MPAATKKRSKEKPSQNKVPKTSPKQKKSRKNQLQTPRENDPGINRFRQIKTDLFGNPIKKENPAAEEILPNENKSPDQQNLKGRRPEETQTITHPVSTERIPSVTTNNSAPGEEPGYYDLREDELESPEQREGGKRADAIQDEDGREGEIHPRTNSSLPEKLPVEYRREHREYLQDAGMTLPPLPEELKTSHDPAQRTGRGNPKLPESHLVILLQNSWTPKQISLQYGITTKAVRKRIAKLKRTDKISLLIKETPDGRPYLDFSEQIRKINEEAFKILSSKKVPMKLEAMKRIEKHNELQLRVGQLQASIKAVQEFQQIILDALESVDPELKERVLEEIRRRRSAAAAIGF